MFMECFDSEESNEEMEIFKQVKNLRWEEGTRETRSRVLPKEGVYGMKINQVVNDIEEYKIDDNENEENLNVIYFCEKCQEYIENGRCSCNIVHDLEKATELKDEEVIINWGPINNNPGESGKCNLTKNMPVELKMSLDHSGSPRGLLGLLEDEKDGIFREENCMVPESKRKQTEFISLKDRRDQIKSSFNRNKDGGIIHRFPLQQDPMELHEAFGHPSDEVLSKMEECAHGVPVMRRVSDECELCRSLRRRRIPKKGVEGADHTTY